MDRFNEMMVAVAIYQDPSTRSAFQTRPTAICTPTYFYRVSSVPSYMHTFENPAPHQASPPTLVKASILLELRQQTGPSCFRSLVREGHVVTNGRTLVQLDACNLRLLEAISALVHEVGGSDCIGQRLKLPVGRGCGQ